MQTGAWFELDMGVSAVSDETLRHLDQAAAGHAVLEMRYALLMGNQGGASCLPEQLFKVPRDCQELATLLIQQADTLGAVLGTLREGTIDSAGTILDWLLSADAQRRPERFGLLLGCLRLAQRIDAGQADLLAAVVDGGHAPGGDRGGRLRLSKRL